MRYKKATDDSWTDGILSDPYMAATTISGLQANTEYQVQFQFTNDWGTSDWDGPVIKTSGDTDHDGIADSTESAGPNNGDANGDGTADYAQANVTSWINQIDGKYVVLQTDCDSNGAATMTAESSENKDVAYNYSAGLMNFSASGCGTTATITQFFYGGADASKIVARKYNSVTHTYTTISGAVATNVSIGGQTVLKVSYQIIDNGPLDENSEIGVISDPSGPAQLAVGVPNTGLSAL
jgi:hypothetical protein